MNIPRPQGTTYGQGTATWQQGSSTPVTETHRTNIWSGTAINVDEQSPSHTVTYEEGSLQPERNYVQHTYKTPLAPLPGTGSTSTSTTVYAQPIGSQEASEEVFGSHNPQPHGQYPSQPHNPNSNRQNFTRNIHYVSPANTWVPITTNPYPQVPVITHLMPPIQSPQAGEPGVPPTQTQPGGQLMPPFGPAPQNPHILSPPNRSPFPSNPHPSSSHARPASPSGSHVNTPITHLMPPMHTTVDRGQRPLTENDPIITEIHIDNYPGQPWSYDINQLEPVPSGSRKVVTVDETNLYGGLKPPLPHIPQPSGTPRSFLSAPDETTQIPPPSQTTTPITIVHGYPKLSNATIQTFPNQPHYSPPYSEVAHSRNTSWVGRKIPQHSSIKPSNRLGASNKPQDDHNASPRPRSENEEEESTIDPEQLPLKEALQLMLRPYLNRSGTIDDDVAAKAQSHIMNLVGPVEKTPEVTTTTHIPLHATTPPSISIPSPTPHQKDVELILAGEQHSLVTTTTTTSTQPGNHKTGISYDFQHTTVDSQRSTQSPSPTVQSHDHDSNWHKYHQHTPSSSKHHHQHSREFHEKHPHLPNPFDAPEEPSFGIDVRSGDVDCPFDCGNGKCIGQHEVSAYK